MDNASSETLFLKRFENVSENIDADRAFGRREARCPVHLQARIRRQLGAGAFKIFETSNVCLLCSC